jgi:hypothetical protein
MRFQVYHSVCRFGLMHLIASNLAVWLRMVVVEILLNDTYIARSHFSSTRRSNVTTHGLGVDTNVPPFYHHLMTTVDVHQSKPIVVGGFGLHAINTSTGIGPDEKSLSLFRDALPWTLRVCSEQCRRNACCFINYLLCRVYSALMLQQFVAFRPDAHAVKYLHHFSHVRDCATHRRFSTSASRYVLMHTIYFTSD